MTTQAAEKGTGRTRAWSAVLSVAAFGVLLVAAWLEPAPAGHSTHTQLGLSPCSFLLLTEMPCPMCGATTAFALMAEGRVLEAVWIQPFAVVLFLGTVLVAGIGGAEALAPSGRWIRLASHVEPVEAQVAATLGILMIGAWIWKIAQMWI